MIPVKKCSCFLIIFGLLLTVACDQNRSRASSDDSGPRKLTVVQSSDIFTLDPHTMNETVTHSVLYNIMEPLIKLDEDLKIDVESSLAKSWINPDEKTWTFFLRQGVTFHNGKPLTAEDVKASLDRARYHPLTDVGGGLGNIESIKTRGHYSLVIEMKEPSAVLPRTLNNCMIFCSEQVERWSEQELDETPIGTGPYRLLSWKKGSSIELEAFEDYRNGAPAFDTVTILIETDPEERAEMIADGRADLVMDIPVDSVDMFHRDTGTRLITQEGLRVIYLGFDVLRDESPYISVTPNPLKDRRVREAFYRAIDEHEIVTEILNGYGNPASQFCSPYVFGFNPSLERLSHDPERAKELLAEAGYPDGFSLTLHCPNNRYVKDREIGAMIVDQLRIIGLDVTLEALPKEVFIPELLERKYSFYLAGWDCPEGDAISVFIDCLHTMKRPSYGHYNTGGYSNSILDSLVREAERTIDPVRRTQIFEDAQRIAMNDIPWIPLHTQVDLYGIRSGLTFDPRLDKQLFVAGIRPAEHP